MIELVVKNVVASNVGSCIVLTAEQMQKVVPIFIGPLEAQSIAIVLEGEKSERPMTHDLLSEILKVFEITINKVVIDNFVRGIIYAKIFLSRGNSNFSLQIDARPSDAIGIAIRNQSPIFIEEEIFTQIAAEEDTLQNSEGFENSREELLNSLMKEFDELVKDDFQQNMKKKPKESSEFKEDLVSEHLLSHMEVLQQMLKTAVSKEDYERAAELKKEIEKLSKNENN